MVAKETSSMKNIVQNIE